MPHDAAKDRQPPTPAAEGFQPFEAAPETAFLPEWIERRNLLALAEWSQGAAPGCLKYVCDGLWRSAAALAAEERWAEGVAILAPFCDLQSVDRRRLTALAAAADRGFGDVAQALLDAGADPSFPVGGRGAAICFAIEKEHWDCVGILAPKTDWFVCDEHGEIPLMIAAKFQKSRAVALLATPEAGALKNRGGRTALMMAIRGAAGIADADDETQKSVEALLPVSDANAESHRGETALAIACKLENKAVALALIRQRGFRAGDALRREVEWAACMQEREGRDEVLAAMGEEIERQGVAPPFEEAMCPESGAWSAWGGIDAVRRWLPREAKLRALERAQGKLPLMLAEMESEALRAQIGQAAPGASEAEPLDGEGPARRRAPNRL